MILLPSTNALRALVAAACVVSACAGSDQQPAAESGTEAAAAGGTLFTLLPSSRTGVRFRNQVTETRERNVFTYRNYYNGGGVALGDLTGDGLPELFLTANLGPNRLYLNEGDFHFRDVTDGAGVSGKSAWATGVTFADVNGDGLLDIYVCYAGPEAEERRANELYIHQGLDADGVPTFKELAAAYGVADRGYGTQASFFDYDRDGDLDLYLVNNSPRPVSSFGLRNDRHERHPFGGDKLYRQTDGRFEDVSAAARILGSEMAFGLGVGVGDLNRDGWLDIYVTNDFFERDYLYLNNRDGTFTESLETAMPTISLSSMGLDFADIDNDGWLDVYVTDMLPQDEYRLKTTTSFDDWEADQSLVALGYHHQSTRNTLQRNNGNGTFSEVGQLAGVARTDWSWSALIADFDLDGRKDIHVTNGILRDVTNQDYIAFLASDTTMRAAATAERVDFMKLIDAMHSTPLSNRAFRNEGPLTFSDAGVRWGLDTPGFSNGAAYGDLDGDGDIDLVVNNVNQEASVYRNNARTLEGNHYLQVALEGDEPNRFGIGANVTVRSGELVQYQEVMPSRGFQSSVDYVLTFGLGQSATTASVAVEWPDGRYASLDDLALDRRVKVRQAEATGRPPAGRLAPPATTLTDVTARTALGFIHHENAFVDFQRERLAPKMLSREGPFMAVADVNGDGLDDAFIGGAKEQPGRLLIQERTGGFAAGSVDTFERDRISEDLGAVFFDADGDGAPDLYVVSGGSEFSDLAPALQDRLYLNNGRGAFRSAGDRLPAMNISGSRVAVADVDGDGDLDLFVGGRVVPWRYGIDPRSVLLENDGRGRFTDVTARAAPDLMHVGMVTDAVWHDVDGDGRFDLIVVGEWMPITVFHNVGSGQLERQDVPGLERTQGWWNRIVAGDFTGDGRVDFVVGNLGLNTRLRASDSAPLAMYVKDFDHNGFVEQIMTVDVDGVNYPFALRDELLAAVPTLRAQFPTYQQYARQRLTDIFGPTELADAVRKEVRTLATSMAVNNGDGSFTLRPLPIEAQLAPIYGVLPDDVDGDGAVDLLLAGNFDGVQPEIGRMNASFGLMLRGDGRGGWSAVPARASGFVVPGQARDIQRLRTRRGVLYIVARNNDRPLVFTRTREIR